MSKVVYGIVGKDGDKENGKGFTSKKKETGEYEIKFNSNFKDTPAVTATAEHKEDDDRRVLNVVIDKETAGDRKDRVIVPIQTPEGKANNNRFHFIAIADE